MAARGLGARVVVATVLVMGVVARGVAATAAVVTEAVVTVDVVMGAAEAEAIALKAAGEKERAEAAARLQRQFDDFTRRIESEQRKAAEAAEAEAARLLMEKVRQYPALVCL